MPSPPDKFIPVEEHEWIETICMHLETHMDMPYLSRDFIDDDQNLSCITGDVDGYIPQWIVRMFDWLSSYKKGDKLCDLNTEHLKISSSGEDFPSNLLTCLSRHFDTSMGPLIHHSLFELFETIAVQFTGETIPKKATLCIQLFLLLVAPHKRLNMQFLFTSLARISANDNLMCDNSEERLTQFMKLFIPCVVRSKERITRTQSDLYTDIIPVLCYMTRNVDTAFDVPADVKAIFLAEIGYPFLSKRSWLSIWTDTREELLENIMRDLSLTKVIRNDLLQMFSVVYPEIYHRVHLQSFTSDLLH